MRALILEKPLQAVIKDVNITEDLGPSDVRIAPKRVGICGSDMHYYLHGRIGQYIMNEPMIPGHEAAGIIVETGKDVKQFKVGDRVCMEPGIPESGSKAVRSGIYNLDPKVRFWATPPIHGVMRETVVHPADYTFKLPDNVSFAEGAMVEPLAIGLHASAKAHIKPGDTAVVLGAGTIGVLTALSALAGGCSRIIITDIRQEKLDMIAQLVPITAVNTLNSDLLPIVMNLTDGWGADIVFECSGSNDAAKLMFECLKPAGCAVIIGIPNEPLQYDVPSAQAKEARVENVFRYAHIFDRAIALISAGRLDVKPLITNVFKFEEGAEAFAFCANPPKNVIKVQIDMS